MAMTVQEATAEIKTRMQEADLIEKRYDDPEKMPQEEREHVKQIFQEVDDLEARLVTLEDAEVRRKRILQSLDRHSKPQNRPSAAGDNTTPEGRRFSPGQQFLGSVDYREAKMSGLFNSNLTRVNLDVTMAEGTSMLDWANQKTLLRGGSSTSGQAFVLEDHQPGFLDILQNPLNVLDLIPRSPTDSDTIEYVRESTFTNSAAFVAEATAFDATALGGSGVKPESALAYSTQTATVRTMAHWIPVESGRAA